MEKIRGNVIYVTYEEAQKLKPFFEAAKTHGPYKEARESAGRILGELRHAKPIDYSPLKGYQMFLGNKDHEFLMDVLDQMEDQGEA